MSYPDSDKQDHHFMILSVVAIQIVTDRIIIVTDRVALNTRLYDPVRHGMSWIAHELSR